jgi:biopolymer transport protein ExbD
MRQIPFLLIACCSCGQPPAPPIARPTVSLPYAEASAPNQLGDDTIRITLTRDGRVAYQGRWVTLDQLGKAIRVEWPAGRDTNVLLRCDRAAPWIHASWLLQICAESNLWRTHFAVRESRAVPGADRDSPRIVACFLPVERGLCVPTEIPQPALLLWAQVLRDQQEWKFRTGKSAPLDLERFEEHTRSVLHESRGRWKVGPIATIQAPGDAPVEAVLALIGTLGDCGAIRFAFATDGSELPAGQRAAIPLTLPRMPFKVLWAAREPRIVGSHVEDGMLYWDYEEEPSDD